MRIIHTSDWHLGKRLGRVDRTDDLRRALHQVAEACRREQADVLLICGDVFEQGRADVLRFWVDQLNEIFVEFLRGGATILAITGNHDHEHFAQMLRQAMALADPNQPERGGLLTPGRFYLFTGPTFFRLPRRTADKAQPPQQVQFIAMPWPSPAAYLTDEQTQAYPTGEARNRAVKSAYVAAIHQAMADAKYDRSLPTVLAAHVLTSGAEVRAGVRAGERDSTLLRDEELPSQLAYIALGDVHKPQTLLGLPHVRYCGSIDRMDLGEAGDEKGVVVIDIGPGGLVSPPRWVGIEATPVYSIEIDDPANQMPMLTQRYPDHERALVKVLLKYRAGRDDLNAILAELDQIFPRCYHRDWKESSGTDSPNKGGGPGGHGQGRSVRQTVMEYLETQLDGDEERKQIIDLAAELLSEQGQ